MVKKNTWQAITGISLVVLVAIFGYVAFFGGVPQQAVQTGGKGADVSEYVPFQLYEVNLQLRDAFDKIAVPSGTFYAKVFEDNVNVDDMKDPRTPYVEMLSPATDFATSGILTAVKTKILTGNDYRALVYDTTGTYYATTYDMSVPELEAGIDSYTFGPVYVEKIGSLGGVTTALGSVGVSVLQTGGNAVYTIDLATAPSNIELTAKVSFTNEIAKSVIKDLVIRSVNDAQNPLDKNAISLVRVSLDKGDELGIPSDITTEIKNGQKIELGDITDTTRAEYEFTIRLDKALLQSGDTFYIYFDDLGDYLGEDVNGDNGMTPKYIKIVVA